MTWEEFKMAVEAAGVRAEEQIAWIDWNGPAPGVSIDRYSNGDVKIVAKHEQEINGAKSCIPK